CRRAVCRPRGRQKQGTGDSGTGRCAGTADIVAKPRTQRHSSAVKTPTGRPMFALICCLAIVGAFVGPGTTVAAASSDPAIIMLMVDDLPPTEVEKAVREGELPNIEEYFYRHGTRVENFFTSLAISSASWSTILTGRDVDESCIKGNDVFHNDTFH